MISLGLKELTEHWVLTKDGDAALRIQSAKSRDERLPAVKTHCSVRVDLPQFRPAGKAAGFPARVT